MESVAERFLAFRKKLDLTQAEMASKINTSRTFLSQIETGDGVPGGAILLSLNLQYGMNVNWLLTGKGEMFLPATRAEPPSLSIEARVAALELKMIQLSGRIGEPSPVAVELPFFSDAVAAGTPSLVFGDNVDVLSLDKSFVRRPSKCFCVRVSGDSMTGSGIEDGDILVVERDMEALDGKIVVVRLNGAEVAVKKIRRDKSGEVTLVSTNPERKSIRLTSESDALVLGVIVLIIRKL